MDEFSFPIFATEQDPAAFPHFASSQPWFLSSSAKDNSRNIADETDKSRDKELARDGKEDTDKREYPGAEEKMDMLWEQFNEEIYLTGHRERKKSSFNGDSDAGGHGTIELCRVQTLEITNSTNGIIHNKPNLLVLMKVIKKLLLIHKNEFARKSPLCSTMYGSTSQEVERKN